MAIFVHFSWRFEGNFSVVILLGVVMRTRGYQIIDLEGEINGLTAYFLELAAEASCIFVKRDIYAKKMVIEPAP